MNLCHLPTIRQLMEENGLSFQKRFGQNFLVNEAIPQNIAKESYEMHAKTNGKENAFALEIGPGVGCLTKELSLLYDRVCAVEIDRGLIPVLAKTLGEFENCRVINDDFMKIDLPRFLDAEFGENSRISVCANLPYYITTPILTRLLEEGKGRIVSVTVMVQAEVGARLCAAADTSDYGAITAVVRRYGTAKKLFDVSAGNFVPAPKVESCVVQITLYPESPFEVKDQKMLTRVINGAFAMRRKTFVNSLSSASDFSKEEILFALTQNGYGAQIRGEALAIEDYVRIANTLFECSKKEKKDE